MTYFAFREEKLNTTTGTAVHDGVVLPFLVVAKVVERGCWREGWPRRSCGRHGHQTGAAGFLEPLLGKINKVSG